MPLEAVISTSGLFNVLVSHGQPLARATAVIFAASRPLLEMGASNSHVARTHANCSRTSPREALEVDPRQITAGRRDERLGAVCYRDSL